MKAFRCRYLGLDCEAVARAESDAELLQQVAAHAEADHAQAATPEMIELVKRLIREE